MKNIALIGFMGTGKTTIACLLAEHFKMECVDTDQMIIEDQQTNIVDIFSKKGEKFFRQIEKKIVADVCSKGGQVISCGGGVVLDQENIDNLRSNGVLICLKASAAQILKRTENYGHRPLLNVPEPEKKINDLLKARKPYYEKADFTIDTTELTKKQVAEKIIRWLKDNGISEKNAR